MSSHDERGTTVAAGPFIDPAVCPTRHRPRLSGRLDGSIGGYGPTPPTAQASRRRVSSDRDVFHVKPWPNTMQRPSIQRTRREPAHARLTSRQLGATEQHRRRVSRETRTSSNPSFCRSALRSSGTSGIDRPTRSLRSVIPHTRRHHRRQAPLTLQRSPFHVKPRVGSMRRANSLCGPRDTPEACVQPHVDVRHAPASAQPSTVNP